MAAHDHDHGADCDGHCCCARTLLNGVTILFIFIGLAIFASIIYLVVYRFSSIMLIPNLGVRLVWDLIVLLFAIWIVSWVFRVLTHRHRSCCCCCTNHDHRHGECCCGDNCNCEEESKPAKRKAKR